MTDKSSLFKKCIADVFQRDDLALAISTGTPGPFKKITTMIMDSEGKVLGYAKIGETELAIESIKNEASILKLLVNSYQLSGIGNQESGISYPECLYEGEIGNAYMMIQTPSPFEGKSGRIEFNEDYAEVLSILIKDTIIKKKFNESEFYKNLKEGIDIYSPSYKDVLQDGLKYLEETLGDREITFALSHGDFAPWNMLWRGKEVFLYDWESACLEAPAGIDLIHFLFQTGFLLKKQRGYELLSFIIKDSDKACGSLSSRINGEFLEIRCLLLSYFLHMAVVEDEPQQLSKAAVERRNLIKLLRLI